jgi:hypothetical protein
MPSIGDYFACFSGRRYCPSSISDIEGDRSREFSVCSLIVARFIANLIDVVNIFLAIVYDFE